MKSITAPPLDRASRSTRFPTAPPRMRPTAIAAAAVEAVRPTTTTTAMRATPTTTSSGVRPRARLKAAPVLRSE